MVHIVFLDEKNVIIVHSTHNWYTAIEEEERLSKMGYEVTRINLGNDTDVEYLKQLCKEYNNELIADTHTNVCDLV